MRYLIPFSFICAMSGGYSVVSAQVLSCPQQQAIQAETEASTLSSWDAVYRSFTQFEACDQAAISEGYSESVSRLLADDWKDVNKLVSLARKNVHFEAFVIKHIDETVPAERLRRIIANARSDCPQNEKDLCAKIIQAAE